MAAALELPIDRIERVYAAIDTRRYPIRGARPDTLTVGFLARQCQGKGLDVLVDAFIQLRERGLEARLRVAGASTRADREFRDGLKARLREAGEANRVSFRSNITFQEKIDFFHGLSVLSVPATYGEAFGLYAAEAMACGVPLVQPDHGPFPETVGRTGSGILVRPDDTAALADGLQSVLESPSQQDYLSQKGRYAATEEFDLKQMAAAHLSLLGSPRS